MESSNTRKMPPKNFRGNAGDRKKIKNDSVFNIQQSHQQSEDGCREMKQHNKLSYRPEEGGNSFYQSSRKRSFHEGSSNNFRGGGNQNYGSYSQKRQFHGSSVGPAKNIRHEQPDMNARTNSSYEHLSYKNNDFKHSKSDVQQRHFDRVIVPSSQQQELSLSSNQAVCMDSLDAPIKPPELSCNVPVFYETARFKQKNPSGGVYTPKRYPWPYGTESHGIQKWHSQQPQLESYDMYLQRKDHDIGEGRFLRDFKNMPPRFQNKFKESVKKATEKTTISLQEKISKLESKLKSYEASGNVSADSNVLFAVPCKSDENRQNGTSEYGQQNKIAENACVSSEVKNQVYQFASDKCADMPSNIVKTESCGALTACAVSAAPSEPSSSQQSSTENSCSSPLVKTQAYGNNQTGQPYKKKFQSQMSKRGQRNFRYNNVGYSRSNNSTYNNVGYSCSNNSTYNNVGYSCVKERTDANKTLNSEHADCDNKPCRTVPKHNDNKPDANKALNSEHAEWDNKPCRTLLKHNDNKPDANKALNSEHAEDNEPCKNLSKHNGNETTVSSHEIASQSHVYNAQQYSSPRTNFQLGGSPRAVPPRKTYAQETSERNVRSSVGGDLEHSNHRTSTCEYVGTSTKYSSSSNRNVGKPQKNVQGIDLNQQDDWKSHTEKASNSQEGHDSVEGTRTEICFSVSSEEKSKHHDNISSVDEIVQWDVHSVPIRPPVSIKQTNVKESMRDSLGSGSSEFLNVASRQNSTGWRTGAVSETSGSSTKDYSSQRTSMKQHDYQTIRTEEQNPQSVCTEVENQCLSLFSDDQLSVNSDHSTNNRKIVKNLVNVQVSRDVQKLDYWTDFLQKTLPQLKFDLRVHSSVYNMLSITFSDQTDAKKAWHTLKEVKGKENDGKPFIKMVKFPKSNYYRNFENKNMKILGGCLRDIAKLYARAIETHERKIAVIRRELDIAKRNCDHDSVLTIQGRIKELEEMQSVFLKYTEAKKKMMKSEVEEPDTSCSTVSNNLLQMKKDFICEYNCFKVGLPIYAKKEEILDLVAQNQVSVLVAETGSGKSTQLVQYLLRSDRVKNGLIVCTQPRKIAAISIAKYISGQLGSPVGSTVGYEAGLDKKTSGKTRIAYMTDYALLRKCVSNRNLEGISCVVIDEAHERSLFTDLLLAVIKKCLTARPDIRIIITSATIDPRVFKDYFSLSSKAVLSVPGRMFPVEINWQNADAYVGWNFLEGCVKLACKVHEEYDKGDILVFLTSPQETDEAVNLCKQSFTSNDKNLPMLFSLHGRQDLDEQMKVFSPTPKGCRKIVFATNAAETSVTIPGIKFVIDSGMVKEKQYIAEKNRNALVVGFISKSSAEQRKGRAGRTRAGVCYRLYSKKNYEDMPDRIAPEILRINLQLALLRILEFKIQPEDFDFVESPRKESIASALNSLEFLGVVKNKCFTDLGKQLTKLPLEPQLGKLVILGAEGNVGFEAAIIASIATVSGMVFYRNEDNRERADKKKIRFCKEEGDFLTFLDVFKEWYQTPLEQKPNWCAVNCINAKAMRIAFSTAEELIQTLNRELRIKVYKRFKPPGVLHSNYEKIIFECFAENICVYSGHKKTGYLSPFETGSFFVHPSSSLCYLDSKFHSFIIFGSVLKTSRSFLLNVTPVSENTIVSAYQRGVFPFQIDMLKELQIMPARIYPVGEAILIREILGRQGSKLHEIEQQIKLYAKTDAFHIDVKVEKGEVLVYVEQSCHATVIKLFATVIQETLCQMAKEEEIFRIAECASSCFAVSSGGIVNDVLLPGEFREVIVEGYHKFPSVDGVISKLKDFGALQSYKEIDEHGSPQILATYVKARDAQRAVEHLQKMKHFDISSKVSYAKLSDKSLPLFRLQITWPRFPCLGTGWVSFHTVTDCIEASGILTNKSFYIDDKYIVFTPARNSSEKVLQMKNLPPYVEVSDIMCALKDHLPECLKVKSVELVRKKWYRASENEMNSIKKQLFQMFGQYTPSSKLVINLRSPNVSEILWTALVYFENFEDGEKALKCLTNEDKHKAKIGEHKLQIRPVLKSSLHCTVRIYELVKKNLHYLMSYSKNKGYCTEFDTKPTSNKDLVLITFSCNDIKNLDKVRQEIRKLVKGTTLPGPGEDPVPFLRIFSKSGEEYLKSVEQTSRTVINVNSFRKTVTIYGLQEGVSSAKSLISCYISSPSDEQVKVFNLCGKKIPSGFLKALHQKYGFQLNGLIEKFSLRSADTDFAKRTLTVKCSEKAMRSVEQCLAELCVEVKKSLAKNVSLDQETCPVCLDVIASDLFRLNHCGHAFCRECLLLQIASKTIPLLCSKQGCEKPLFIEDIKKLLVGNEELKKEFSHAALKNFISKNNSVRYCPMPDCSMVYRVSTMDNTEFHCPSCENDICTRCHAFYHHGMTCEMFQKSKVDEHYSVKVWMQEDTENRKQCPRCSAAIEKVDGCNHMQCTSCDAHICWLCLRTFTAGQQVYDHMPFCESAS